MVDVSTAWAGLNGWLVSVRHLELPSNRSCLQVPVGTNTTPSDHPTTVACCAAVLAGAAINSGPPWRCRRTFPCRSCQRGLHMLVTATSHRAQTRVEMAVSDVDRFLDCTEHFRLSCSKSPSVASLRERAIEMWGLRRARCTTGAMGHGSRRHVRIHDDGPPMDGFWRIKWFKGWNFEC